tara:strand:+ start:134 stop:580 length:447 start_codon:yes stop_codon:yes gene_type:complete
MAFKMKVKIKNIQDLIFADYNPRILTKDQHKDLTDSLTRFGFVDPVIININSSRKNMIIGGHQRTRVWKSMGHKTVPCVELDLTIDQEKELNVRLNKNVGSWDHDMLANNFDLDELKEWGFDDKDFFHKIDDLDIEKDPKEKCEHCGK